MHGRVWVAAVRLAGDLVQIERHRNNRRPAPCSVLAGVEAIDAQGVVREATAPIAGGEG